MNHNWIYFWITLLFALVLSQGVTIDKMQQEMHQMQVVLTEGW